MTTLRAFLAKYNPNQPRKPKGDPNGGQFTSSGGSSSWLGKPKPYFLDRDIYAPRDAIVAETISLSPNRRIRYDGSHYDAGGMAMGPVRVNTVTNWFNAKPLTGKEGLVKPLPKYGSAYGVAFKTKDGKFYETIHEMSSELRTKPTPKAKLTNHFIFSEEGLIGVPAGTRLGFVSALERSTARQLRISEHWEQMDRDAAAATPTEASHNNPAVRRASQRVSRAAAGWKPPKIVDGLRVRLKESVYDSALLKLGGDTAEVVGRILAGAKEHKLAVDVDYASDRFGYSFNAKLLRGSKEVGTIERRFHMTDSGRPHYVSHSYFALNAKYQGHGIAKSIFREAIPQYQKLGFKEVRVGAGLSQGGYAWAKYGFVPDKTSWGYILNNAKYSASTPAQKKFVRTLKLSRPKDIWKLADSAWGHDMLAGSGWEGVLKFSDRESMERFHAYVGAATPTPPKRKRTLKKTLVEKATRDEFVMAELLDPDTPPSYDTLMRHRAELKARGLDEATLNEAYPIKPLQKLLREKSDKLA